MTFFKGLAGENYTKSGAIYVMKTLATIPIALAGCTPQAHPLAEAISSAEEIHYFTEESAATFAEYMPPAQYRLKEVVAVTYFSNNPEIDCGGPLPGGEILGCHFVYEGVDYIILPNACLWSGWELYATIVCHEAQGHVSGWKHPE